MTKPDDSCPVPDAPSLVAPRSSRRALLTAAAAALTSVVASKARASPLPVGGKDPVSEGFFLVWGADNGSGGDNDRTRIFFVPSTWLSHFEITDLIPNASMDKVLRKIDKPRKKTKWDVLYSDYLDSSDQKQIPGVPYEPVPPPSGYTYLAMSIDPA